MRAVRWYTTGSDTKTHHYLLLTAIVGFLHDRQVKVIEIEFTLKGHLVEGVKEVKGERRFRPIERCGVPAHP